MSSLTKTRSLAVIDRAFRAAMLSVLITAATPSVRGQALLSSTFWGGPGNQTAAALAKLNGSLIAASSSSGHNHVVRIALPTLTVSPATIQNNAYVSGFHLSGSDLYGSGGAEPPVCGASDGVGGTEPKGMLARYDTTSGSVLACSSQNASVYRGYEGYFAISGDANYIYTAGFAETAGFGPVTFILASFSQTGSFIDKVAEPGFNLNSVFNGGKSFANGVTAFSGDVYVVGFSALAGEDGVERPVLMRYTPTLARVWKSRPTDIQGNLWAVAGHAGALYTVGWANSFPNRRFLVQKYDLSGNRLWSSVLPAAGDSYLNDLAFVGDRLHAIGTGTEANGHTFGQLLEIDTSSGGVLASVTYNAAGDEAFQKIVTDGSEIYILGHSNSFATPEGNAVGQFDTMLLRYSPRSVYTFGGFLSPVSNPPVVNVAKAGRTIPIKWQITDGAGGYISDLSAVTALTSSPVPCDGSQGQVVDETLESSGSSTLRYDSATNTYVFNWKTERTYSGCRLLTLTLADAQSYNAKFSFE